MQPFQHASATVSRSNHKPQPANGKQVFLADFVTEKAKCSESITL